MRSWSTGAIVVLALICCTGVLATAGQHDKMASKSKMQGAKGATMMCPVCKTMALTKMPTKSNTVAVRLKPGGPVMYCCAMCKMPASVMVKKGGMMGSKGKMHSKGKMKM